MKFSNLRPIYVPFATRTGKVLTHKFNCLNFIKRYTHSKVLLYRSVCLSTASVLISLYMIFRSILFPFALSTWIPPAGIHRQNSKIIGSEWGKFKWQDSCFICSIFFHINRIIFYIWLSVWNCKVKLWIIIRVAIHLRTDFNFYHRLTTNFILYILKEFRNTKLIDLVSPQKLMPNLQWSGYLLY